MALIAYVKSDGTGDFTDLVTGINTMLSSGVAAGGTITEYILNVDSSTYSGNLNITIPYSGSMNVIGNNTSFYPTGTSYISGDINQINGFSFKFSNFDVYCNNLNGWIFDIRSDTQVQFTNVNFFESIYGIRHLSSTVILDRFSSYGPSSGIMTSGSYLYIYNSKLSHYENACISQSAIIDSSIISNNLISVKVYNPSNLYINKSLLYSNTTGVDIASGNLFIDQSSIDSVTPIKINNTKIHIQNSILYANSLCISGNLSGDHFIVDSCFYPSGWIGTYVGTNIINSDPKLNDKSIGDFRLKFKDNVGSSCIEHSTSNSISGDFLVEKNQLVFKNKFGSTIDSSNILPFSYKQGSSILFTDYDKEIAFANINNANNLTSYSLHYDFVTKKYNITTQPTFDYKDISHGGIDKYPWDWDYKNINTPNIVDESKYLIPRSYVDLSEILYNELFVLKGSISYSNFNKTRISVFNKVDNRGITYDYKNSKPGRSVIWILDGNNHTLKKQNSYTLEEIETYPLLCPKSTRNFVRPSGLIYVGAKGNKHRFILENDPNQSILAESEYGDVNWICTNMDLTKDLRGLVVYKDNLFLSLTEYSYQIDQDKISLNGGVGRLLMYDTNDDYINYTKHYNYNQYPLSMDLASGNTYPTDMTIYEDGSILVLDYLNKNYIYSYKLAYDYALVQNSYDNDTLIMLRENYNDVRLRR